MAQPQTVFWQEQKKLPEGPIRPRLTIKWVKFDSNFQQKFNPKVCWRTHVIMTKWANVNLMIEHQFLHHFLFLSRIIASIQQIVSFALYAP